MNDYFIISIINYRLYSFNIYTHTCMDYETDEHMSVIDFLFAEKITKGNKRKIGRLLRGKE